MVYAIRKRWLFNKGLIMNELLSQPVRNVIECIESWHDTEGNWYRIYSDGYIEQGGFSLGDDWRTITLHKPYSDTNYLIILTQRSVNRDQHHCHCALHPTTKTINSFYCNAWAANNNTKYDGIFYYCAGY